MTPADGSWMTGRLLARAAIRSGDRLVRALQRAALFRSLFQAEHTRYLTLRAHHAVLRDDLEAQLCKVQTIGPNLAGPSYAIYRSTRCYFPTAAEAIEYLHRCFEAQYPADPEPLPGSEVTHGA